MSMLLENLTHDQALQALIRDGFEVSSDHGAVADGSTATVTLTKGGRQVRSTVVGQDATVALVNAYAQFEAPVAEADEADASDEPEVSDSADESEDEDDDEASEEASSEEPESAGESAEAE